MSEYIFSERVNRMPFESILITGTSCAGKSTITKKLCESVMANDRHFEQVKAVTTRARRAGDSNYDYINDEDFDKLLSDKKLLVDSTYRGKKYGIKKAEYDKVIQRNKIPLLMITPASADKLSIEEKEKYMCIFLDAPNETLLERWIERLGHEPNKREKREFVKQNETDRIYQDKSHYILNNTDLSASISLISLLWKNQDRSGPLSQELIKSMIDCGVLLRGTDPKMIKGASYDLRLGDEYYYSGEIRRLSEEKPFLTIEPYDYAIVSCKETACIPRDVIAKFGLTVGLFCQGIILSNGPQIDPGFRGTLFCLLFNTSNRAVHLKRGKHHATIEFNKLMGYAGQYKGQYQGKKSIIDYIPGNALQGAINELKKEVEQLKSENRIMQNIYLGVVALMFAIISILLVVK